MKSGWQVFRDIFSFAKDVKEIALAIVALYGYLPFALKELSPLMKIAVTTAAVEGLVLLAIIGVYWRKYKLRVNFMRIGLEDLKKRHLISTKDLSPSAEKTWRFRRRVYWPVVPNPNISIIHIAFLNCLRYLMANGFDIYILVFDLHYQGRRVTEERITNRGSIEKEVDDFVNYLKNKGLKSHLFGSTVKYKYESVSMNRQAFMNYSNVCEELTLAELKEIRSDKTKEEKREEIIELIERQSVLRLLKPISIIALLVRQEQRRGPCASIAMTLCGIDEERLYTTCHHVIKSLTNKAFIPFQVYIPKFDGFERQLPGVLDPKYNVSPDNKAHLIELAKRHTTDPTDKKDPIIFLINYLLFGFANDAQLETNCTQSEIAVVNKQQFMESCGRTCINFNECVIKQVFRKLDTGTER